MNKYYKLFLSFIITAVCIYFAFRGENYISLFSQIRDIKSSFLILSILLLVFSCYIRALRWKYILSYNKSINTHLLFGSVMVGYFGNNVLPFRLGEILRSYSAAFYYNISFTSVLGSVVLERIMDLGFVIIMFFIILPWFPIKVHSLIIVMIFLAIIIISFFLLLGLAKYFSFFTKIKSYSIFKNDIFKKLINVFEIFSNSIISIKNSEYNSQIIFLSIILWGFYYFATYFILLAFNIDLDFLSILVIIIVSSIAIGIPAMPGAIGTYEAGVKFAMVSLIGITSEKALAFALVSHAASFIPFTVLGAIYFFLGSVKLSDLKNKDVIV